MSTSHARPGPASLTPHPTDGETLRIHLTWLLKLRWGAIAGQIVTIFAVWTLFGIDLPLPALLSLVAIEAASNAALWPWVRRARRVTEPALCGVLALDVLILTGLLLLSGGRFNPFSFLYLVHIALAAVVLSARWTWGLVVLSCACFGSLFVVSPPGGEHAHDLMMGPDHMHRHLEGMWVAFTVAAAFIVHFVTRVTRSLRLRERQLAEARDLASRCERLASLATLAAGVAHELATPLSTIAVAAKELSRRLEFLGGGAAAGDARLIREQVTRCQQILERMSVDAGSSAGERIAPIHIEELVRSVLDETDGGERVGVSIDLEGGDRTILGPRRALGLALSCIVKNACQASLGGERIEVRISRERDFCRMTVRDCGTGMRPEILARAGEPFFTTKAPGHGMGLGLFLTRAILERLGGRFELDSADGEGTTVSLLVPARVGATIDRIQPRASGVRD
jgi:two-component system sensor histidine kinase RegB